jgi:hypothetical protein
MRYSKRTSSYSHRWLVRRDPAFRASARATRRQLSAAIGAPTDVATVRKAVAQVSRFDDALDALQLRMPYASLFSCYR